MLTRSRDGTLKPPPPPLYPMVSSGSGKKEKNVPLHNQLTEERESVAKFVEHLTNSLSINSDEEKRIEDFSLPESWTKEKSNIPPFRQLKQNYYRPPLQKPVFSEDDILICNCSLAKGGCNENCQNRLMLSECIPDYCHCTTKLPDGSYSYCGNCVIQQQLFPKTSVFPTQSCDFGLRADEKIPPNTIIVEYMGEVITKAEFQKRISKYSTKQHYYFAALDGSNILDANGMGSIARFANHSCEPNCILQRWYVGTVPHIVLVSTETIYPGEEITYSYGFTHDDNYKNNPVYHQKCYCGSKYCNGMIGSASVLGKEITIIENKLASILGGADDEEETENETEVSPKDTNAIVTEKTEAAAAANKMEVHETNDDLVTNPITAVTDNSVEEESATASVTPTHSSATMTRKRIRTWSKETILQYLESIKAQANYAACCNASSFIVDHVTKVEDMLEEYELLEKEFDQCIMQMEALMTQEQRLKAFLCSTWLFPTTSASHTSSMAKEIEEYFLANPTHCSAKDVAKEIERLLTEFQQHPWKSVEYEKHLQHYLDDCEKIEEEYLLWTQPNSQSAALVAKGKKRYWSDYIISLRRLYAYRPYQFLFSVMPTFASPHKLITTLFHPYQQIQTWCREHILPFLPYPVTQALVQSTIGFNTTTSSTLNTHTRHAHQQLQTMRKKKTPVEETTPDGLSEYEEEYRLLVRLMAFLWALSTLSSTEHQSAFPPISLSVIKQWLPHDMFGVINYLDTFLSTHIIRQEAIVDLTTVTALPSSSQQPPDSTTSSKRKSKGGRGRSSGGKTKVKPMEERDGADEEVLHCYCQLEDEDSENHPSDMIECTQCTKWFHTVCLNIPTTASGTQEPANGTDQTTKGKGKGKTGTKGTNKGLYLSSIRQSKTFYCCACNYEAYGLNHYALTTSFQVISEVPTFATTTPSTPQTQERLLVEWKYLSQGRKKTSSTTAELPANSLENALPSTLQPMVKKSGKSKTGPKHRGYWYTDEFQHLLTTADSQLLIKHNPVIGLLTMLQTYVNQWQLRTVRYLHHVVPLCHAHMTTMASCLLPPTTASIPSLTTEVLAARSSFTPILHALITLLREPFLLHVQDTTRLLYVQSVVWCISSWVINYALLTASPNYRYIEYYLKNKVSEGTLSSSSSSSSSSTASLQEGMFSFRDCLRPEQLPQQPLFTLEEISKCVITGKTYCQLLQWRMKLPRSTTDISPEISSLEGTVTTQVLQLIGRQTQFLQQIHTTYSTLWQTCTTCDTVEAFVQKNPPASSSANPQQYDDYRLLQALRCLVNIEKTFPLAKLSSFHMIRLKQQQASLANAAIANEPQSDRAEMEEVVTAGGSHSISAPMASISDALQGPALTEVGKETNQGGGGGGVEVYCWCRKPATEEDMIACDRCEEWFHYSCVGFVPHLVSSKSHNKKRQSHTTTQTAEPTELPPLASTESLPTADAAIPSGGAMQGEKKRKRNAKKVDVSALDSYFCIACSLSASAPSNHTTDGNDEALRELPSYPYAW